ncbi:hypothetical protein HDV06_005239 [Boothiomyces sp. JEL0866]|nr:hypothetical protein HDV06_005239 [Boothiomyces sp. JEL0866]
MSQKIFYTLAFLNIGISLGLVDYEKLSKRKFIQVTVFTAVLAAFIFCFAQALLFGSTDGNSTFYHSLSVISSISDFISTISLELSYIKRLAVFMRSELGRKSIWIMLIVPLCYIIVPIVGISSLYINTPSSIYVFAIGNAILALTDFCYHSYLFLIVRDTMYNQQILKLELLCLILLSAFLFILSCIWSVIDPKIGGGPIYGCWTFDIVTLLVSNRYLSTAFNSHRHTETQSNLKGSAKMLTPLLDKSNTADDNDAIEKLFIPPQQLNNYL